MTSIISTKTPIKNSANTAQKNFNRLKNKIETLQREHKELIEELDESLRFYLLNIQPKFAPFKAALVDFIKTLYSFYKVKRAFSKNERRALRDLIECKLQHFFAMNCNEEADPEINAIFEEFEGIDYNEMINEKFDSFKESLKEMCGEDVDLSDIGMDSTQEDVFEKIFESMGEPFEKKAKKKTEKQLQNELKEQAILDLQKKGLGSIYKKLAKVLHPDLEQDPIQKIEKEDLMKKLTCAYENQDLHTILSLEMQVLSPSSYSDDQLGVYTSLLKKQIKTLESDIEATYFDPRYMPIQKFLENPFFDGINTLQKDLHTLQKQLKAHQDMIKDLKKSNGIEVLRAIL